MKMAVEPVAPGVVKVILDGRLDIAGAGVIDLQFSAIAGSHRGVVVDLAGVSFLASIGIMDAIARREGGSTPRRLLCPAEPGGTGGAWCWM